MIHVGTFRNLENAEDMVSIINSQIDYEVYIFSVENNNDVVYRVQVGPFNADIADQVLEDIKYIGNHDAKIVKYK